MVKQSKLSALNVAIYIFIANFFGFSPVVIIASMVTFLVYYKSIKKWGNMYKNTEAIHIPRYFYLLLIFPFSISISLYSMKVPGYEIITGISFIMLLILMVVFRLHILKLYIERDQRIGRIYQFSFIILSVGFFGLLVSRVLNNIQNTIYGTILLLCLGVGLFIYLTMNCEQARLYKYKNCDLYLKRVEESFERRSL